MPSLLPLIYKRKSQKVNKELDYNLKLLCKVWCSTTLNIDRRRDNMLYRKEREELKTLIQTGYPLIYIVTADERPVIHVLKDIIKELKDERHYTLRTWDRYEHLYDEKNGNRIVIQSETDEKPEIAFDDPISLMENIRIKKAHTITVLHDFHNSYDMKRDKDRGVLRALKSISYDVSMPFTSEYSLMRYEHKTEEYYKHMIITSPFLEIPKEIEK